MAGIVKIDTESHLGGYEDDDGYCLFGCNAHDTYVWHWADQNCAACEEKAKVNADIPVMQEKLDNQGKFLRLAEIERDNYKRKLEALEVEMAPYIAQKRAVEEAVKKAL